MRRLRSTGSLPARPPMTAPARRPGPPFSAGSAWCRAAPAPARPPPRRRSWPCSSSWGSPPPSGSRLRPRPARRRPDSRRRCAAAPGASVPGTSWDEVTEVLAVRARADALLARHPLRAADAGQLGAALLVREEPADALTFVCLDRRLSLAAEREGLRVATPAHPHVMPVQVKDANAGLPVGQIPDDVAEPALQPFEREIVFGYAPAFPGEPDLLAQEDQRFPDEARIGAWLACHVTGIDRCTGHMNIRDRFTSQSIGEVSMLTPDGYLVRLGGRTRGRRSSHSSRRSARHSSALSWAGMADAVVIVAGLIPKCGPGKPRPPPRQGRIPATMSFGARGCLGDFRGASRERWE